MINRITNTTNIYHGTSKKSKESVIASDKFHLSNKENEWAGTGIYFFIDQDDTLAMENARCWAAKIKKLRPDNIAIIIVNLNIDQIDILDLTERSSQMFFHKYREATYKKIVTDKLKDKKIVRNDYNEKKLDCYVINLICQYFHYNVVIRDAYINFGKTDLGYDYPKSSIPNCTIVCVRNNEIIASIK